MTMAKLRLKYVNAFRNSKRTNDRLRHYFRRRGQQKAVPLPGLPGSEEFMAAYTAALATLPDHPSEIGARRTQPGTIDALAVSYYQSGSWLHGMDESTRQRRRPTIERFRERHGSKRVALLRRDHVEKMLGEIDKPHAKKHWLKAIRGLLKHAVPTMRRDNPCDGINVVVPKSKGHHTWTDAEVEQFRVHWLLGTVPRLAMEFALETVSRGIEITRLGRQHVHNGRIRIERAKGSDEVNLLLSDELRAAIEAMPKANHLLFVAKVDGSPMTPNWLSKCFAEWAIEAGLPARCRMHGLKKGGMRRDAEDGFTAHELMAKSGHKTLSEVQRYTEAVDNQRLVDSGHAKRRKRTKREDDYTNTPPDLHKQNGKPLKLHR
jgi:Phage integrase family